MKKRSIDFWYRLGKLLAKIFIPTFGSIEVVGQENVPPFGPLIIAANHQSNADPPVIVYAMPRPVWFMAKRSLFNNPFVAYLMRSVHVYPVDRDKRDLDAVKWALSALGKDRAMLVFPEGTRSPGSLKEGTPGLAYLALRSGAPVLPIAITGTEQIRGMFRIAFHFKRLKVTIGQPVLLPSVDGRLDKALLASVTDQVMERIAGLLPVEYRGVYAAPRSGVSARKTMDSDGTQTGV